MRSTYHLSWSRFLLVMLSLIAAAPGHAMTRQDSRETAAGQSSADKGTSSLPPPQDSSQPDSSAPQDNPKDASTDKAPAAQSSQAAPLAAEGSEKETKKTEAGTEVYALTSSYSITLPLDWVANTKSEIPPPAPLSPYAPPFHLSGNLVLLNPQRGALLQFATSDDPFVGHDAYWLDTQMHSPTGSGMSLLDFFFYYFFPPSDACMHEVLTTYAPASRVSPADSPAYMQVYYSCPLSDTLSGFYSTQVSAGITFQLTDNGTRVLAPIGDFYVAPMEQIEESGLTFFVFEAQGLNAVTSDAAKRFHLPDNAQGGQPDFFWAIAATSPFPFVADPSRKDVAILHVAYARLGVDTDAKSEFMNILGGIRTH
ncbi:MAG: hypothetical protein ABSA57_13495 [Candidatus Acidiferrales bacterium]|jgi:hypothetical protein